MFDANELMVNLKAHTEQIKRDAAKGLAAAAENILAEAVRIVPLEEGTLQNSGVTRIDGLTAAVGFGAGAAAPYAVRQHEDLSLHHDQGRTAKYLEKPFMAAKPTVAVTVARFIK